MKPPRFIQEETLLHRDKTIQQTPSGAKAASLHKTVYIRPHGVASERGVFEVLD